MADLTLEDVLNLALEHHRAGRIPDAEYIYRQILDRFPNHADVLNLLGVACQQRGRADEALRLIRRAIEVNPNVAPFHFNLAGVLQEQGRAAESLDAYRRSIALAPNVAPTHLGLGGVLESMGRMEEAVAAYDTAARIEPTLPNAHFHLGRALARLGQFREAVAAFEATVRLAPGDAGAHAHLGSAATAAGDSDRAVAALTKVTELEPDNPASFGLLGDLLGKIYRLEESVDACRRAVEMEPRYKEALGNLGLALLRQGRISQSIDATRRAVELPPPMPAVDSNLLLALHYDHTADARDHFAAHVRFGERYGGAHGPHIHTNDRSPDRRLRIGYVSPDFRDHPVAYFVEPLLANHDRERFEIFCYSDDGNADAVTERLRQFNVTWRPIHKVADEVVAQRIRDDHIDVLVELAGHTAQNRLLALTRRPAPVQVTYLGYPNTTGLSEIDYRLTDAFADPPGDADDLSVERLVRLPRSAWCYQSSPDAPEVGELPARKTGRVTFASFNAIMKINPPTMELWSSLLKRVPDSQLLLKAVAFIDAPTMQRIAGQFERYGIEPDRLILRRPQVAMSEHHRSYHDVDIALDPAPYNGTTTTCEALWMGVPVVTIAGNTHASRVGVSLLSNVGLSDLIAKSPGEFLDVAASLASDLDRVAALRAGLRERMKSSPLMDAAGFTRDVEDAYRRMWKEWCRA